MLMQRRDVVVRSLGNRLGACLLAVSNDTLAVVPLCGLAHPESDLVLAPVVVIVIVVVFMIAVFIVITLSSFK